MSDSKDSKKLSEERYSKFAQGYVESQTHAKGYDLDQFIKISDPQPDWQMLDIATGGGHTALTFAPHVKNIIASDLTENMLLAAEKNIKEKGIENITFRQADAENLPFDDEQFDLVTCRIAAHHFPNAQKFVQETSRVLKPGGRFLLQDHVLSEDKSVADFAENFETLRDPSHNHAFSLSAWTHMLVHAGFEIYHQEEIIKRHPFIDWVKRQGHGQEVISELEQLLDNASETIKAWLSPLEWGTPDASFVNHHILIGSDKKS
ncbi:MAG: methyltransferase domain-containing protein [Chloroflexi bacterium]|jgi:ubiquinone/menaquinone biosynthesis C-methylase UbiE|nr:methyltransferase domain-containing protein [Chloroflexota bacterium]MBT3668720.1 methyltransferase domain-containing protein [Chloroflexota bacterium]MBT4002775.1 methyltransferase domain-containing protein [Chloroflexota bacterium]MBT4305421.1 methyltransferase domain-containing protein [Chloroflexota bacterium]MBT4533032.1 methyltransferase domain-containing protein [Chloroflexota bacterium]